VTKWRAASDRVLDLLPRPLDPVRSIKLKLGILLLASGAAGGGVFWYAIGWMPYLTAFTAVAVALVTSQILAHGMTSPLRQMTAAARAMARGDYSRRVRVSSQDEVGELGRAFNLMAADLAAADRQRRELIANVSHELRTPISALQAVLENVVDGVVEPDPATLATALKQTERLGKLVSELLDLSRIDSGVVPLALEDLPVRPFLQAAVAEAAVGDRPVRFSLDVYPADLEVVADQARLHQVVANLLDNASRHSPAEGCVTVRARQLRSEGGLLLEVADEGPGIPPELRERVFERFTRGASGAGAGGRDGGTGLGLAIVRWVVDLHGGAIAVVGKGPGCRIRVTLPPVQPAPAPDPEPAAAKEPA
jgi:signal transduction histidine kinase